MAPMIFMDLFSRCLPENKLASLIRCTESGLTERRVLFKFKLSRGFLLCAFCLV